MGPGNLPPQKAQAWRQITESHPQNGKVKHMMRPANLQIQYPSKKSKVSFSCGHIHLLKTKWTCWISTPGTDSRTPPKVSGQKSSIPTNFMDHMVGDSYTVYIYNYCICIRSSFIVTPQFDLPTELGGSPDRTVLGDGRCGAGSAVGTAKVGSAWSQEAKRTDVEGSGETEKAQEVSKHNCATTAQKWALHSEVS